MSFLHADSIKNRPSVFIGHKNNVRILAFGIAKVKQRFSDGFLQAHQVATRHAQNGCSILA
jgi:hypothetical protein